MIQILKFLIFMSSFIVNCSQQSIPEKKTLHQPKPLIIVSEDVTSFRNSNDLANLSKNNINHEAISSTDEKEKSSRLSLSAVTSCLLIAQRRHSKWSSPNSNKRASVKSNSAKSNNDDDSDTQSSPNDSGKAPKNLKKTLMGKSLSFYSNKTEHSSGQAISFCSDTDDDGVDYQKECALSLERAQQEILVSLQKAPIKIILIKKVLLYIVLLN